MLLFSFLITGNLLKTFPIKLLHFIPFIKLNVKKTGRRKNESQRRGDAEAQRRGKR
jgi:hypothetical protein